MQAKLNGDRPVSRGKSSWGHPNLICHSVQLMLDSIWKIFAKLYYIQNINL